MDLWEFAEDIGSSFDSRMKVETLAIVLNKGQQECVQLVLC